MEEGNGKKMPHFITSCQKEGRKGWEGTVKLRQGAKLPTLMLSRNEEAQAAGRGADFGHLGYPADAALVLLVILSTSEGVGHARRATEDRGEGGGADVELSELVKLDIDGILRVALALSLDLLSL
jgi:hypothetical protein